MRLAEEFEAEAANGKRFTICKCQGSIPAGDLDDPSATLPGLPTLRTFDGMAVNNNGDGIYTIVELNLRVRRVTKQRITN